MKNELFFALYWPPESLALSPVKTQVIVLGFKTLLYLQYLWYFVHLIKILSSLSSLQKLPHNKVHVALF